MCFTVLLTDGFWSSPRISISLCSCQSNREIWTKVVNFTPKFAGKLPGSLRRKFTLFGNAVGLSNDFQNESIHSVRKIPSSVRENIVESWLGGKGPTQIGKELRLQKQIIANIIDNFVRRGNSEAEKGGNKTRFNRAYWRCQCLYSETSFKQTPSFKPTLSRVPKLTSCIPLSNEPLLSGHVY